MIDRKEQILDTAETLLRKFGAHKTTVVDVAGELGISHAAIYRYYPSKSALREAIVERWLHRISAPLGEIVRLKADAETKLRTWIETLVELKRKKVLADPELFAAYHGLADSSEAAVGRHIEELKGQVATILSEFPVRDAEGAAAAVLEATASFHHPHFVEQNAGEPRTEQLDLILNLLIKGLRQAD